MRRLAVPVVFTLLMAVAMAWQARTFEPVLCAAPDVRLTDIPGFTSEVLSPSDAELHVLPPDTRIDKRLYTSADGRRFQVSLVIGGRSKSSIHRPELCLPAQGFQMADPQTIEVAGVSWRRVTLARREATSLGFAYTFFNQDGYRTSSHVRRIFRDVWDRSVRGRIDRWAMVTVNASSADEVPLAAFLASLKGVAVP